MKEKMAVYENIIIDLLDELMEAADQDYLDEIIPEIFASVSKEDMMRFGLEDYIESDEDEEDDE